MRNTVISPDHMQRSEYLLDKRSIDSKIERSPNINNKRVLYINVDDIELYYKLFKDDVESNYGKYMQFIRSDKNIYDDYLKLCDTVYEVDTARRVALNINTNIDKTETGDELVGGNLLTAGVVVGSFVLTSVVAAMLWYFLNPPEYCKESYPLYPRDKIPDVGGILEKILPGSWIKEGIDAGKSINDVINEISDYLDLLTSIFSVFDESSGSTVAKAFKSTTKIALSVGAAVVTGGLGGDKIVNVPFFITKAVNMTTKTFNKLFKVTTKITKTLQRVSDTFRKVQSKIDQAVTTLDALEQNKTLLVNSLKQNRNQLAFIYDLFNVDFKGGPFHTECWVNFIMTYYISSNERVKEIYMLLCVMNDIYLDINDSVIGFVGSTLDMVIPESMGIAGTIAPLLKDYSYILYRNVREQITDNYNDIPREIKALIQNPPEMSKYIFQKFSTYSLGLSDLVIPDAVKQHMEKGIDLLANGLHKGLSMVYMFLNIFIIFSELNAGVNKALVTKNLDAEILLKECAECGSFEVKGLDNDGNINPDDLTNCKKCKKFYIDDENQEIDDTALYNKCMGYKDKRDKIKIGYQKLKGVALDTYTKLNKGVSLKQEAAEQLQSESGKKVIKQTVSDIVTEKEKRSQDGGYNDLYRVKIDEVVVDKKPAKKQKRDVDTLFILNKIYHDHQKTLPVKMIKVDLTEYDIDNVQTIMDRYDTVPVQRRVYTDF